MSMRLQVQFIPKLFSGVEVELEVEVEVDVGTLEFFHSNFNTACLQGAARFVHWDTVVPGTAFGSLSPLRCLNIYVLHNCERENSSHV